MDGLQMSDQKVALGIDPLGVFVEQGRQLSTCQDECIVVLDTNVLLVPYNVGKTSLADIVGKYKALADKKRLVIPAQVAIEFARNRSKKVGEIIQSLSNISSGVKISQDGDFPVLASTPEYDDYVAKRGSLKQVIKEYQESVEKVVERIRAWEWDDPVAVAYRGVLKDCVVTIPQTVEALEQECKKRYAVNLPPGYKDAGKVDGGSGDFVIWKTILKVGAERKAPVIFVTGEEKPDWVYKANNKVIAPRYELVDEFRRESAGKEFFLISLVEFLRLFHAEESTIKQVQFWASDDSVDEYFRLKSKQIINCHGDFIRAQKEKNVETGLGALRRCWVVLSKVDHEELVETKFDLSELIEAAAQREFIPEAFSENRFWHRGQSLFRQARKIVRGLP